MKLKKGIYEQVINKALNDEIKGNINDLVIDIEAIDHTDASSIFSSYLKYVINNGLDYYKSSKKDLQKQIEIVNKLISEFSKLIDDEEFNNYQIDENNLLRGIYNRDGVKKDTNKVYPITSIAKSSLFTGSSTEPTVFSELNKEILTADRVDLLVSFIKFSGLRLIIGSLIEHTKTKKLRVLTTSYMGASDFKAIKLLSELPNTEVRISYDTERTRLHAKAYYFHRDTGYSTAYIGSSNISKAALTEGTEWNMKVSEYSSPEIIDKYRITFETYWNTEEFRKFDVNNVDDSKTLMQSLGRERINGNTIFGFDIRPYAYQQEILDKLEVEREIFKSRKNLIVAATGTGKTVVSAFDFKKYYKENPNCKLLFLAHRKEILEQSISTFRGVLKNQNFGDLWVADHSPNSFDHIFVSIQNMNINSKYLEFEKGYFDYIVLDETHHGAAESYDQIINYFSPDILLGLTATPERMDGKDILKYFNDRIAYEIRLGEAIDRNLLCPFHYFGVTDNVDLSSVKWSRGKYEFNELSNLYTGNDARADLIIKAIDKYITDIDTTKGIGFCVSKDHAKYMAKFFCNRGISSENLDSDSSMEDRVTVQSKLRKGQIKFIFVVDLYNEGVDIPEINTVLFLRPTESATVFIQQLGRGLRISEDKDVLTVLDFVGQANKQYNFRTKLRSMIGKSYNSIEDEISNEFPTLPNGCFIQLERKAKEYILENIKQTYANRNNLRKMLRNYRSETNKPLNLRNFLIHYQLEPWQIYKTSSFYELCYLENLREDYTALDSSLLGSAFKRLININSLKLITFLLEYLTQDKYSLNNLSREEQLMLLMFHYTIWDDSPNGDLIYYLNKLRNDNMIFLEEIIELLRYNRENIDFIEQDLDLGYDCPLELYAKYSIDQILAAMGEHTIHKKKSLREGVLYLKDKETDLFFITLDKSENHFSTTTKYEDYAISERLFHWQSQSRTSDSSPTGQRYLKQRVNGNKILLFVRENRSENLSTSPYYFLGKANYVSHEGSKPISIVWELEEPMPTFIYKKANKVVNVI